MKKCVLIGCLLAVLAGCGGLSQVTPETPLGDPEAISAGAEVGSAVGNAVQTIGQATGNATLAALGMIAVAIAGIVGTAYGKKK